MSHCVICVKWADKSTLVPGYSEPLLCDCLSVDYWFDSCTVYHLLNISEFVYFVWGLSLPKRRVVHADAYRPCAKHLLGFMSEEVVVTKKWHFSKNYLHISQQLRSRDGSVDWLDRLAAAKDCAINSVTVNSTGVGCVRGRGMAGLSEKRLVINKRFNLF